MTHWMCTTCGYYLHAQAPPERCPSCEQACAFSDVTCYRPECGGEQNIDPLAVGSTMRMLRGGPALPTKTGLTPPSSEAIPLVEIMRKRSLDDKEDLEHLSFWSIPQVQILRGLSKEQRQQIRGLGRVEHYESDAAICAEGEEARKFYLIQEGRVAVESQVASGMRFPITILSPGEAFGWSALVHPFLYTASVTALHKTKVITIERESLMAMMQADPALGLIIMQNVASIVSSRLRHLELALVGLMQHDR